MSAQAQDREFDRTANECEHYRVAEGWLIDAEEAYHNGDRDRVDTMLRFAAVHAQLAQAADIDRAATAEDRIAGCVPEGGSRFGVAVAR